MGTAQQYPLSTVDRRDGSPLLAIIALHAELRGYRRAGYADCLPVPDHPRGHGEE